VLDNRGILLQADAGFGPHAQVLGEAPLFPLKWEEYRTVKVEVGVDRDSPSSGGTFLVSTTSGASAYPATSGRA